MPGFNFISTSPCVTQMLKERGCDENDFSVILQDVSIYERTQYCTCNYKHACPAHFIVSVPLYAQLDSPESVLYPHTLANVHNGAGASCQHTTARSSLSLSCRHLTCNPYPQIKSEIARRKNRDSEHVQKCQLVKEKYHCLHPSVYILTVSEHFSCGIVSLVKQRYYVYRSHFWIVDF